MYNSSGITALKILAGLLTGNAAAFKGSILHPIMCKTSSQGDPCAQYRFRV